MPTTDRKQVAQTLRFLRRHYPADRKVIVRVGGSFLPDAVVAQACPRPRSYVIHLGANRSHSDVTHDLIHEWAHVVRFSLPDWSDAATEKHDDPHHDVVYWAIHGCIFNHYFGDA